MFFLPKNYVTMPSILLAFLFFAGSTRAFGISIPEPPRLNELVNVAWTRSEQDQGDFIFALHPIPSLSDELEILGDVPNLSSGTISINITRPGAYEVFVPGIGGSPIIPSTLGTPNPQPSASSRPPKTVLSSATSTLATPKPSHHPSSFPTFPTLDSILSSSTATSSSSAPISIDCNSVSSSVSSTSGPVTIPSASTAISSPSDVISTTSQSISFSPTSASGSVSVSRSSTVTSRLSSASGSVSASSSSTATFSPLAPISTDGQSTTFGLSSTLVSVTVPNLSSVTSSSPLNSINTYPDDLPTTSYAGFSSAK
ncbi:hypothetical protein DFS33DRAFT_389145 [Desarmillaria ectypa]|nr:hypothetical protein DFS33DRAFT_389145 [Desarmillaria ectypa]